MRVSKGTIVRVFRTGQIPVRPYARGSSNRNAVEDKLQLLARYLSLPQDGYAGVLRWVLGLRERIGIAHTLAEIGVSAEHVSTLAPMAERDPSTPTNPVKLTTDNCARLYMRCIEGRLAIP